MKTTKVKYQLSGRRFDSEITVYEKDDSLLSPQEEAGISWASHGQISVKDAKVFAKALNEAIEKAEQA